jgi:hypothetical protein
MKFLCLLVLLSHGAFAKPATTNKILPISKAEIALRKEQAEKKKLAAIAKDKEDCDAKAKKKVEITPEAISLTGNTGCSLDEAKP